MHRTGFACLLLVSLALSLAGCGKKDETPAPAPAATQAQTPAPQPEPTTTRDKCKKAFTTNCALPCERTAQTTERDPARLKTAMNHCMITCLQQAETACPQAVNAVH